MSFFVLRFRSCSSSSLNTAASTLPSPQHILSLAFYSIPHVYVYMWNVGVLDLFSTRTIHTLCFMLFPLSLNVFMFIIYFAYMCLCECDGQSSNLARI